MTVTILSIILFLIFSVLSGFHFYWLAGGMWGVDKVIPTKSDIAAVFSPPPFATLIVAVGLLLFGLLYLALTINFDLPVPRWIMTFAYWFIPGIFILRSIGEFKYVGFFKKVRNTKFAKADSQLFSPLCMVIGIMGILIQLMK